MVRRHLKNGALLLYDVTSTYLEGRCCELARTATAAITVRDRPQLVIGLMCAANGCPVAIEVFEGNTADPLTVSSQIDKLRQRFKLQRVVMVGDRRRADQRPDRADAAPGGTRLDHRAARSGDHALAAEGGPVAALAVR